MLKPNQNYANLKESYLFYNISQKVNAYLADHPGAKLLRLGIGDVSLPLCPAVIQALHEAVDDQANKETFHGYLPECGAPFLREAIATHYKKRGIALFTDEVFVSSGASDELGDILDLFDKSNTALIMEPAYPAYVDANIMAGRKIVHLPSGEENGFLPMPDESAKADLIYLCSPNNPTGTMIPKEELEKIAELAKKHQFWVISDEIYCELVYDGSEHVSIGSFPGMKDYTIILNGFSKSFAMTGWRIGYIAAPNELLSQIVKVHGYNTICAPIFSQYAAAEGLRNGWKEVERMRVSYQQRRNLMEKAFNEMGLPVPEPKGAFYMFPDISATGLSSEEFATRLFKEHNVAVVPGSVFGAGGEGHIRVCYATAVDKIKIALERIELMVKSLQ